MNIIRSLTQKSEFLASNLLKAVNPQRAITIVSASSIPILAKTCEQPSKNINFIQAREYKTKTRLRKRCQSCYFMWRNGRIYVECDENPRHKQHHVKSILKGYESVSHGYDIKAEKAEKEALAAYRNAIL